MIFGEVIDQGIVKTMEESIICIFPFPQEDKINLECLSFNEEGTLEPKYSLSLNSGSVRILEFNEIPRDITNEEENSNTYVTLKYTSKKELSHAGTILFFNVYYC